MMSKKVEVMTFDEVLANHLQNHPVPISTTMVNACKVAIDCINRGERDALVDLPSNARFHNIVTKKVEHSIPAFKIAIIYHLDEFLNERVKEDWEKFLVT
jgi:hypothetical protein